MTTEEYLHRTGKAVSTNFSIYSKEELLLIEATNKVTNNYNISNVVNNDGSIF